MIPPPNKKMKENNISSFEKKKINIDMSGHHWSVMSGLSYI